MLNFMKIKGAALIIATSLVGVLGYNSQAAPAVVSGNLKLWYTVTITFDGPQATEAPATFADNRLDVTFTKGSKVFKVPGYFAADGDAANTSATAGNKWRVKFTPNEEGTWTYTASFLTGKDIAGTLVAVGGTPVAPNGETGTFTVLPKDPVQPGFYDKGILQYVGEHHLQFEGSKEWFVKGGAGGPENLTGYFEFDGTVDKGGTAPNVKSPSGLHEYPKHVQDWKTGDPLWKGTKGKGIIGHSNYLASTGANSIYVIPANSTGDGYDSWPWTDALQYDTYDVSKLDQWDIVWTHMDAVGIDKNYFMWESESTNDIRPGPVRNIYYREIIARFSHCLAIRWNISEEPSIKPPQSGPEIEFIDALDPYHHSVGIHTHVDVATSEWSAFLQNKSFSWASGQIHNNTYAVTLENIKASANAGRKWIVAIDEGKAQGTGANENPRKEFWENVMAGGEGNAIYFGYGNGVGDCDDEDYRLREYSWKQLGLGIKFWMSPIVNRNLGRNGGFVATNASIHTLENVKVPTDAAYVVLAGAGSPGNLDMSKAAAPPVNGGKYEVWWYEMKTGGKLLAGSVPSVAPGASVALGTAPGPGEWVVFVGRSDLSAVGIQKPIIEKNINSLNVVSMSGDKYLVTYKLANPARVSIELFNSQGALTKNLSQGELNGSGEHTRILNGSDIPKGINFLRLIVSDSKNKVVYSRPLPKGI